MSLSALRRTTVSAAISSRYQVIQHSRPITIAIAGTGVTGLWTAYSIRRELARFPERQFRLAIIGKGNWQEAVAKASKKASSIFSHEASGFEPIGIQPHSGLLWNTDNEVIDLVRNGINNPQAAFYTAPDLCKEGQEFLDLYTGWHGRHPDQKRDEGSSFRRQEALIKINRYARKLWGDFQAEKRFNSHNNPIDLHLKGAWRVYHDPTTFANVKKSVEILRQFDYEAQVIEDSDKLAREIPFYAEAILKDQMKGVFFKDDGLVSSNKLRDHLWMNLTSQIEGMPNVTFHLDSEIESLKVDTEQQCCGVVLKNGNVIDADATILAMGLANKHILVQYGIRLPLWNVWGAAIRGELKDSAKVPPQGGVSFHAQRCITAAPDGKNMIVAGTSMVVNECGIPEKSLYQAKLRKNVSDIFGERIKENTMQVRLAPRTGIADDLPIIGLDVPNIRKLIILNPTSHLGNTQAPAIGQIVANHILKTFSLPAKPDEIELHRYRLDRFKNDIEKVRQVPSVLFGTNQSSVQSAIRSKL